MSTLNLDFIKSRRTELGLSQSYMADKLGFSNSSVYWKYERGIYKFNAEMLPALAKVLKCNSQNFFTR